VRTRSEKEEGLAVRVMLKFFLKLFSFLPVPPLGEGRGIGRGDCQICVPRHNDSPNDSPIHMSTQTKFSIPTRNVTSDRTVQTIPNATEYQRLRNLPNASNIHPFSNVTFSVFRRSIILWIFTLLHIYTRRKAGPSVITTDTGPTG
jgi:hypothetical protein